MYLAVEDLIANDLCVLADVAHSQKEQKDVQ